MYALFDLDDTLHDKKASLAVCADAMYRQFLFETAIDKAQFCQAFTAENCIIQAKSQVFAKLANTFALSGGVASAMLEYFDGNFHKFAQPFAGVMETMQFLTEQNVEIACVTNGRDFFQRNKIHALGLANYFKVIVTSGELNIKKPDPGIFNIALARLNASAQESVFIGDSLQADMQPAKALGMRTIWVNSTKQTLPSYVDHQLVDYAQFQELWSKP